jgi:hypothetical protein
LLPLVRHKGVPNRNATEKQQKHDAEGFRNDLFDRVVIFIVAFQSWIKQGKLVRPVPFFATPWLHHAKRELIPSYLVSDLLEQHGDDCSDCNQPAPFPIQPLTKKESDKSNIHGPHMLRDSDCNAMQ